MPRAHGDARPAGVAGVGIERDRSQTGNATLVEQQLVDARVVQQAHAVIERSGDRCHQHRLLGVGRAAEPAVADVRSEKHTSELQSLMRISYAVFCLNKKNTYHPQSKTYDSLQ